MPLVNEIKIAGRVGTEPTQTGKGPAKFRLAHGGGGQRKDGTPYPTQWFSVSCWDKKVMLDITEGAQVEITGKLRDSTYVAKDGSRHYGTEIVASSIVLAGSEEKNIHGVEVSDDDLGF